MIYFTFTDPIVYPDPDNGKDAHYVASSGTIFAYCETKIEAVRVRNAILDMVSDVREIGKRSP